MKKLTILSLFITIQFGLIAQASVEYSLVRPIGGGELQLMEFDLAASTQNSIRTYTNAEINDYNPEVTCFDPDNNRFITLIWDGSVDRISAIDLTTGNIAQSYLPSGVEVFSLEYHNGKVYSLVRPNGGGALQLMEFDLAAGTQNSIRTYTNAEINDYNPEVTCFDPNNNRFITLTWDGNVDRISAIDITTGNITQSYLPSGVEAFSLESNFNFNTSTKSIINNQALVKVSPNPTTNVLNLNIGNYNNEKLTYQLYDMQGKLLDSKHVINNSTPIVMQELPKSTYLLSVLDNNSLIKTFRIIKN